MVQKKKQKRVNPTPQQLMENQARKSFDRKYQSVAGIGEPLPEVNSQPLAVFTSGVKPPSKPPKVAKTVSLLLTVADLCGLLKVSRSTITRMERDGSLPGRVMVGGSVRYHRETIENWFREKVAQQI